MQPTKADGLEGHLARFLASPQLAISHFRLSPSAVRHISCSGDDDLDDACVNSQADSITASLTLWT